MLNVNNYIYNIYSTHLIYLVFTNIAYVIYDNNGFVRVLN